MGKKARVAASFLSFAASLLRPQAARIIPGRGRLVPVARWPDEAAKLGPVTYEDDFLEARLIFQALPAGAPERLALRAKLLHYLLDPVLALKPAALKREVAELEDDDVYDEIFESFRDALGLYDPSELWSQPARISAEEARLLRPAAEMVASVFAPRGGDQQVALALATLATLSPDDRETQARLDEVLRWTDEASLYGDRNALHRSSSAVDVLESALGDWPAPVVVRRLDTLYADRQRQFSSVLRRPVGGDAARRALGDLLIAHGEEMQRSVVSMAGAYLRAGLIGEAATRTARMAGNAGDDPELRALLTPPPGRTRAPPTPGARAPVPPARGRPRGHRDRRSRSGGRVPRARGGAGPTPR